MSELVKSTKGFSGADIEGVVKEAVETAFADDKTCITTSDIQNAIKGTSPLSEIMKDSIENMKKEYEKRKFKNASA